MTYYLKSKFAELKTKILVQTNTIFFIANWYNLYYSNPDTFYVWNHFIKTDAVSILTYREWNTPFRAYFSGKKLILVQNVTFIDGFGIIGETSCFFFQLHFLRSLTSKSDLGVWRLLLQCKTLSSVHKWHKIFMRKYCIHVL